MESGLRHIVLYVVIVLAPLGLAFFSGSPARSPIYETGRYFALAGFMVLCLQGFLTGRIKWAERPFGLDILVRYHRHMALFGVLLLVAHPFLLAGGGAGWRLIIGLELPWYIWLGKAALAALVVQIALSAWQGRLGVKFERWRIGHDFLAVFVVAAAFTHSWFAGQDLETASSLKTVWVGALVAVMAFMVYHRILRPRILSRRPYRVADVRREADRVWTVTMEPPEGEEVYDYLPGQFHFITFHRGRGLPEEEHHWTISSSPVEKKTRITSTIKELGDFTATIGETRPGDTATIHGPFGRFSHCLHPEDADLVFIAGGIGITPVMSMLRYMRDSRSQLPVLLIYANKGQDDIVFRDEIAAIEAEGCPSLRVVHVLSSPEEGWDGETGRVDRDRIERYCEGRVQERSFYLCGPPGLVKATLDNLREMGVPDIRIRLEIFSFLD